MQYGTIPSTSSTQEYQVSDQPHSADISHLFSTVLATTLLVFLLALLVFSLTIRSQVGPSLDSIELHLAAMTSGVVHPPGSPQYVILSSLAANFLPGPDPAFRVNLFSGLCMAAAIALLHLTTYRLTRHNIISALAAMSIAISPRMWYLGSVAELYALNSLYIAALVYVLITWHQTRRPYLYWLAAGLYTLSFGNHTSMLMLLPMFVYMVLITDSHMLLRPRNFIMTGIIVAIAALQYAQIPIRMNQHPLYCNFCSDMNTPGDFINYVTGGVFRGAMFDVGKRDMIIRFSESMEQFSLQFMPWGLAMGFIGLWEMFRRQRNMAIMLLIGLVCEWIFVMGYNIPDWHDFMSPSYMLFTPMLGYGVLRIWQEIIPRPGPMSTTLQARALAMLRRAAGPVLAAAEVLALLVLLLTYYPTLDENSTSDWDENSRVLIAAAEGDRALLLMPYTFSAAYYYSYAVPYYALLDGATNFSTVPPYDLAGLPLGDEPLYVPYPEVADFVQPDTLIQAARGGFIPRYFIVDPSESRFNYMGLLPVCVPGGDVIAGYEVVAVEMRDELFPLVDSGKWAGIEPWVVFPGKTAACPK
jgi:hypothetical protein